MKESRTFNGKMLSRRM